MATMIGREVWAVTTGLFVHGRVINEHIDPHFYTVRTESNTDHIVFPDQLHLTPSACLHDVDQAIAYWESVQRGIEMIDDIPVLEPITRELAPAPDLGKFDMEEREDI